ncbi:MAG: OmpA family protein, partial [Crocinitomicaceae bacterium]|nr:OmpA family protein [Crocinitomicaceae bacterium]
IFVFEDEGEKQIMGKGYYAMLLCKGEAVPRATCVIKNELGETVLNGVLDEAGKISLDELSLNRKYKLSVTGIDPASYNTSVLRIMDYQGNMIHELYLNSMGWVELELLMFNYTDLPLRTNIDKSILTIDVSGQVYNETPGDVGADKLITIIDEKGETVAVAYTNETGSFRFTNLFPELDYRFHLTEKSNALNIIVLDRGKSIVLPVLEEEAHYIRLKGEEAIQLVNEFNETVYISPEDIFVINRIYYSYNSAELSERAKTQLDRLTDVLNSNPLLHVELRAHTDSRGSSETNLLLSKQRADNTAEYLILHGISAIRITTMGIGES